MCFSKKYKTLAIIGNGFDMAHGYATGYRSFAENTPDPSLDKFRVYCENEASISTWYLFEENINILTEKYFMLSMTEPEDFEDNRREVAQLQNVFTRIHHLLCQYLQQETSCKPLEKKQTIAHYLTKDAAAINFNYTSTAEAYTKNIFYVHGSLAEQDILLGYDYRQEPCLAQYEDMQWSKSLCREGLSLRRYLRKWHCPKKVQNHIIDGFRAYQHWENTGRGLEDEVTKFIPHYRFIDHFLKRLRKQNDTLRIDYSDIKTVVVLGHGIEADQVYLSRILSCCDSLEKIVLFLYDGEPATSIKMKTDFFLPYCDNIQTMYY